MLVKILIGVAVVVVVFLAIVAMQSPDMKVTRSATINAPPEVVFDQVNDFNNWSWNPWPKLDPNIKITIDGAPSGVGAKYAWVGNNDVGEGRMTIAKSEPAKRVLIDMEFLKPMAGRNEAEFTFTPDGDKTVVSWTMTGKKNFLSKAFCMFMNMDKMIGDKFEEGLAGMKKNAETAAAKPVAAEPQS